MGGRASECATPSQNPPVHNDGSNYVLCDGHAKFLRGAQVSSGGVATAADCNQDGTPALPDCGPNTNQQMAAGTQNSQFAATFSSL
jgi:prepilin-type processing-associated H-X9-DG protein